VSETCIVDVKARKVYDSRGSDAVEVEVYTRKAFGRASAPAGASKGKWEARAYPEGGVVLNIMETTAIRIRLHS